jgi:hypothetical protein
MDVCAESGPSGEKAHADIWRYLMTVRTSRKTATFTQPFSLSGIDKVQLAKTYTVKTEEELLPTSLTPVGRRIATLIFLPSRAGGAFVEEVASIDPVELQAAQETDAACAPSPTTTAAISTRTTPHERRSRRPLCWLSGSADPGQCGTVGGP